MEFIININAVSDINEVLIGREILEELYLTLEGSEKEFVIMGTKTELMHT